MHLGGNARVRSAPNVLVYLFHHRIYSFETLQNLTLFQYRHRLSLADYIVLRRSIAPSALGDDQYVLSRSMFTVPWFRGIASETNYL